ncbi:hypothetical protein EV175_005347 [Coemansia sp. RSA 1933]|nr:hypothetical protein EV175_005347 [Coemansia sp. RSA 1933]
MHGPDSAPAFAAFEAIVPGMRTLDPQRRGRLVETMYRYAYTEIEKYMAVDSSTESQSTLAAVISAAISCIEDSVAGASKILALCARNIGRPLFAAEKPMVLLSSLAGNFALASGITLAEMTASMSSLQTVVSHILQDGRTWIAQHEILVHVFQAASDADKEALVQALVRNGGEDKLVRFIGQQANGKETTDIELQEAVYDRVFSDRADPHGAAANGSTGSGELGERKVADMISSMRWIARELKANTHRTVPEQSSQAFRDSFLSLYSEIERVSKDIR